LTVVLDRTEVRFQHMHVAQPSPFYGICITKRYSQQSAPMLHIQGVLVWSSAWRLDVMSDVFVPLYHIFRKVLGCYYKLSHSHLLLHDFQFIITHPVV
jgi:hypothetical protein